MYTLFKISVTFLSLSGLFGILYYIFIAKRNNNDQETEKTGEGNTGVGVASSDSRKQNYNRLEAIDDWFPENKLTEYV